jgi:hypothetical protein
MARKGKRRCDQLPVLHPNAAGIDVGADELFVAVPEGRDPEPIRSFPTFTRDLNSLAAWLQSCGVDTVAMESTSVYWIPVYQILEEKGIEVCLARISHEDPWSGQIGSGEGRFRRSVRLGVNLLIVLGIDERSFALRGA